MEGRGEGGVVERGGGVVNGEGVMWCKVGVGLGPWGEVVR